MHARTRSHTAHAHCTRTRPHGRKLRHTLYRTNMRARTHTPQVRGVEEDDTPEEHEEAGAKVLADMEARLGETPDKSSHLSN
jgi:hypothetical protein